MKVSTQPRLSPEAALKQELVQHATLLNLITDGRLSGTNNATTAAPTSGTHARGDEVKNSAPSELGTAGAKYVIRGWQCLVGGTPGTWVEMRYLTGN
jgi:hypothetical protein